MRSHYSEPAVDPDSNLSVNYCQNLLIESAPGKAGSCLPESTRPRLTGGSTRLSRPESVRPPRFTVWPARVKSGVAAPCSGGPSEMFEK
jgi:hypothetical protein